jgi:hypothetical protein
MMLAARFRVCNGWLRGVSARLLIRFLFRFIVCFNGCYLGGGSVWKPPSVGWSWPYAVIGFLQPPDVLLGWTSGKTLTLPDSIGTASLLLASLTELPFSNKTPFDASNLLCVLRFWSWCFSKNLSLWLG